MEDLTPEGWEKPCYREGGNRPAHGFIMTCVNELAMGGTSTQGWNPRQAFPGLNGICYIARGEIFMHGSLYPVLPTGVCLPPSPVGFPFPRASTPGLQCPDGLPAHLGLMAPNH